MNDYNPLTPHIWRLYLLLWSGIAFAMLGWDAAANAAITAAQVFGLWLVYLSSRWHIR